MPPACETASGERAPDRSESQPRQDQGIQHVCTLDDFLILTLMSLLLESNTQELRLLTWLTRGVPAITFSPRTMHLTRLAAILFGCLGGNTVHATVSALAASLTRKDLTTWVS